MKDAKQLAETIQRLNQAQRITHIGNWDLDLETKVSIWSEEACRIFGLSVNDNSHTYEEWLSFIHPDDFDAVKSIVDEAQNKLISHNFHHRIVRRSGEIRQIYSQVEYQLDEYGALKGLYGVFHDITDIVETKKELTQSEENLKLILDLIPLSIYARDVNGDYLFGNHVFLNHYGICADELKGKNLRDFVRSDAEYKELTSQDQEVLTSGKKLVVSEFRQTDHEGTMKVWRIIKVPFTPNGHINKAILGIAEDITERKKQEEDILSLSQSISSRNRELEKFSFMVSHDLRGPLSTLMGVSEIIDNIKLQQEEVSMFISGIRSSLMKLDNIIRELNEITAHKI